MSDQIEVGDLVELTNEGMLDLPENLHVTQELFEHIVHNDASAVVLDVSPEGRIWIEVPPHHPIPVQRDNLRLLIKRFDLLMESEHV